MLPGDWKCTVTQKLYLHRDCQGCRQDLLAVCRLFLFGFNFCLYHNRVESPEVFGDCFLPAGGATAAFCCWAALLSAGSSLPIPSLLLAPCFVLGEH